MTMLTSFLLLLRGKSTERGDLGPEPEIGLGGRNAGRSSEPSSFPAAALPGRNGNSQMAAQLSIAGETVRMHMTNVLRKLGAHDQTHAVTIAVTSDILRFEVPEWKP